MSERKRLLDLAATCQHLARCLAPYQNRGNVSVMDIPTIPPSPLLKEMQDRVNAIRQEYGIPAQPIGPMLTTENVMEVTAALLSAGNELERLLKEPSCESDHN